MSRTLSRPLAALALAGLAGALSNACEPAKDDAVAVSKGAVVATWVDAIAVPGHRAFADAAATLAGSAEAACADPSDGAFDGVRDDWRIARDRWQGLQVFAFGPYDAYPARLGPHIDFRPLRVERIEERLADPPTAETIDDTSAAQRGLPAIEYLLWAAEAPWVGARCQYLVAATADTARQAEALYDAWADGFAAALTAPEGDPYADTAAVFAALLNRMGDQVLVLRDDKLGRPLGNRAGGVPQPERVSSPFSGRALDDIRVVLDSLWPLYEGVDGRPGLAGLPAISERRSDAAEGGDPDDVDAAFRAAYAEARAAIDAIPAPLAVAVVEHRAAVEQAIAALGRLQTLLQADIYGLLGVELAFGSGDGD